MSAAGFRAVLLDWRGTLAVGLDDRRWAHDALVLVERDPTEAEALVAVLAPLADALDGPGVDSNAALHAQTYRNVLTSAGLDEDLVAALYAVESDVGRNPFALDVAPTLTRCGKPESPPRSSATSTSICAPYLRLPVLTRW